MIELRSQTYVAVGLGFARSVLLPKSLLITANSERWEEFVNQNNQSNEDNDLRYGNLDRVGVEVIVQAAKENDTLSSRVLHEAISRIGVMLADVINLLNPNCVIFAGPLFREGGNFVLDQVKEVVQKSGTEAKLWGARLPLWAQRALSLDKCWKTYITRKRRCMPELKANLRVLCARVLLIASVLLSHTALHGLTQSTDAAAREDRGLELAHAGDLAGAEAELRAAVALAPNDAEFLANLGTVLAMEKKLEDSTTSFERALKLDPSNLMARRYLAANLWQLHRYTEARQNLQLILKEKPNDAPSRLLLGMVAENMKDYSTAVRMLASVPAEVRQQPESIGALAVSYYHLGEKQKARSTLDLLKSHPAGPRAVLLGAQIADEMADYDTAEQLLNSIKSSYSDEEDFAYRLATVQYHAGQFENCEQTLLQSVASHKRTGQVFNLLGWCYQKENRVDDAIRAFENGTKVEPSEESNYLDLENVLLASNRVPAALEVAKKATNALPNSAHGFVMRGAIEMQAGQFSDALGSYRRAKELDPASSDAALGLSDAEFSVGMKTDAQSTLAAGIQNFPKDARFPLHYALVLLKEAETGDQAAEKRAQQLLRSAVKLNPTLVEAHYQLAELAFKNGDMIDALREYETAAKLDPQSAKPHFGLAKVYRRLGRTAEMSKETKLFQNLKEKDSKSAAAASPSGASKN